ncbi:hypothetical protein S4A8_14115 [Salinisphaera sp. S4-8]|uniref:hypothetical protein n=1 Tax=Salinisphaera sp. S4-8 TaxID=633357 RepID=UPI00333ECF9F
MGSSSKKYEGAVSWCAFGDAEEGDVTRAILRPNGELVLDLTTQGYVYSVALKEKSVQEYIGNWFCLDNGVESSGTARATLYRGTRGDMLYGSWSEDGRYQWWVELVEVENFRS